MTTGIELGPLIVLSVMPLSLSTAVVDHVHLSNPVATLFQETLFLVLHYTNRREYAFALCPMSAGVCGFVEILRCQCLPVIPSAPCQDFTALQYDHRSYFAFSFQTIISESMNRRFTVVRTINLLGLPALVDE